MDGLEFTLYQKIDGVPTMRDSDIARLYQRTESAGVTRLMFDDGTITNAREFVDHVTDFRTIFFKISLTDKTGLGKTETGTVGYFWLNRLEATHAYCHFMSFPEYWGDHWRNVEIGQEAMKICLKEFPMIMGMLPTTNEIAITYLMDVGLNVVGRIPNLIWSESLQKPVEGMMLYTTMEDYE